MLDTRPGGLVIADISYDYYLFLADRDPGVPPYNGTMVLYCLQALMFPQLRKVPKV